MVDLGANHQVGSRADHHGEGQPVACAVVLGETVQAVKVELQQPSLQGGADHRGALGERRDNSGVLLGGRGTGQDLIQDHGDGTVSDDLTVHRLEQKSVVPGTPG